MPDMRKAFEDALLADAPAGEGDGKEMMDGDMRCPMCGASAKKIEQAVKPAPPAGGMGGGMMGNTA